LVTLAASLRYRSLDAFTTLSSPAHPCVNDRLQTRTVGLAAHTYRATADSFRLGDTRQLVSSPKQPLATRARHCSRKARRPCAVAAFSAPQHRGLRHHLRLGGTPPPPRCIKTGPQVHRHLGAWAKVVLRHHFFYLFTSKLYNRHARPTDGKSDMRIRPHTIWASRRLCFWGVGS